MIGARYQLSRLEPGLLVATAEMPDALKGRSPAHLRSIKLAQSLDTVNGPLIRYECSDSRL